MGTLWQDLRYACRMLLKTPGFTLVALLTLTLGIGANSAIFSIVNAVLLQPLPFAQPEQLVRISGAELQKGRTLATFSPQDFYDWRERSHSFESMSVYDGWSPSLTGAGEPERLRGARVSASFFHVLQVNPQLGRAFLPAEEQRGNHLVVVLTHALWQRRFGADPKIVGQSIMLSGVAYQIVGVMPQSFENPQFNNVDFEQPELWSPFAPDLTQWTRDGRSVDASIARLKPGVSLAQAQSEMDSISRQLQEQYPAQNSGYTASVATLHEQLVGAIRPSLLAFLVAVGLVLLIACANVANLLLARASVRQKEIAIRTALGAGRFRIIRQLLTESVLLSVVGGGLGLLLALWATDFLLALGGEAIPHAAHVGVELRVLGFTFLISMLTGIAFGLAPALQASRPDLNETLKEAGRSSSGGAGRQRVRGLLVVSEVALSLLLLIGAGLLVKSFVLLQKVSPGFDSHNVLTMGVFLPGLKYPDDARQAAFFDQTLERIRALPGVEAASATSNLPLSGNFDTVGFFVEGQPIPAREDIPEVERYTTDFDYFRALRVPIVAGRNFTPQDRADAAPVVILNETAARRFWPNESAIGKRVRTDPEVPWRTVVGVVGDVRHYSLESAATPQMYLPYQQTPAQGMTFVVRSTGDPEAQIAAVRNQVWAVDKDQPVYNTKSMEQLLSASLAQRRFTMLLLGLFAALALVLAVVGIYGVMSYTVAQRTHEIGIRMALGAEPGDVLRMIVRQGMTLALVGVGAGLLAAFILMRVIAGLLYGVSANDPLTFAGVSLLLASAALFASLIPARRATKVDPMVALRYE